MGFCSVKEQISPYTNITDFFWKSYVSRNEHASMTDRLGSLKAELIGL